MLIFKKEMLCNEICKGRLKWEFEKYFLWMLVEKVN